MAEFPCLPFFTDAYLGDTTHLTTIEHGAYILLLIAQWRSTGCILPNDDKMLARYVKMTPREWQKVRPILADFFAITPSTWRQKRLSDERKFVEGKRQQNVKAGKVSALKRKERHSTDVITDVPTEGQQKPNQPTPLTLNPKERKKESIDLNNSLSSEPPLFQELDFDREFEKLWSIYPKERPGSKKKAKEAYLRAINEKRATTEEIYNGVDRYRISDEATKDGGKWAKGCAAWLNDDRWSHSYRQQGGQHHDKKTGYLDKIKNAGARASQIMQNNLDADRDAPWNKVDDDQQGGHSGGVPGRLIPHHDGD